MVNATVLPFHDRRRDARAATHVPAAQALVPKSGSHSGFRSLGVPYVYAIALTHEAAANYRQFATLMDDHGNDALAELFSRLAEFEIERAYHLAKKTVDMTLPNLVSDEIAWFERGAPVPAARAFVYRVMTPRMALDIALRAEQRAKALFERMLAESDDPDVRALVSGFAHDEEAHIAWVQDALARLPQQTLPNEASLRDPMIAQEL